MTRPLGILALLVALSACGLGVEQAPPRYRPAQPVYVLNNLDFPPPIDIYGGPASGHAAIDEFFPEPALNATAHCIANRESHEYPTSDSGYAHGLMQLDNNKWGALLAAAQTLHQWPWWWSSRQNALAARIVYSQSGWGPWRGPGCG